MGRRTLLLIASILVAALGTALIWLYVQGADTRAQADTSLVQVWVASKAASPGGTVADVAPVPQQVPQPLAADAVTNPGQLGSQQLINGVTTGQILLRSMFARRRSRRRQGQRLSWRSRSVIRTASRPC